MCRLNTNFGANWSRYAQLFGRFRWHRIWTKVESGVKSANSSEFRVYYIRVGEADRKFNGLSDLI